jgi:hypothetical protein
MYSPVLKRKLQEIFHQCKSRIATCSIKAKYDKRSDKMISGFAILSVDCVYVRLPKFIITRATKAHKKVAYNHAN